VRAKASPADIRQAFTRPPRRRLPKHALAASIIALTFAQPARADNAGRAPAESPNLIEMSNARMAPDGTLSVGLTYFKDVQRYTLGFQALPWLEASLEYSGLTHFEPALPANFPVYWDRSFAIRARLLEESSNLPAVAVGIDDLIGTGVNGGEYVVASKRLGPFDASLGMGWGRLAGTGTFANPLKALRPSFGTRPGLAVAGGTNLNSLFHGPKVGLFGGLVWNTPIDGLSLIAEYSSDTLEREQQFETRPGAFKPHSQINYGIAYQLSESASLGLSWLYGRSLGGTLSIQTDPTTPQYPAKIAPDPPAPHIRSAEEQQLAIDTLLGKPRLVARTVTAPKLGRDAFVDRLFLAGRYSDVEIRGRDLVLTAAAPLAGQPCAGLTDLVRQYDAGVDHILLESGSGASRRAVRCDVPALENAAFVIETAAPSPGGGRDDAAALRTIRADAAKQNIGIQALRLTESEAIVYYVNARYYEEDEAISRLTLVLMQDAPARIEKFRLVATNKQEFDVLRAPIERGFVQQSGAELLGNAITMTRPPLSNPVLIAAEARSYPQASWSLFPQFRQSFFDPNNPLALQVVAGLTGVLNFSPRFSVHGEVETSLFQNIPNRASDSLLPHVRSDTPLYVHRGSNGIGELSADYHFRVAPDLFGVVRAGYLESMFAGAGGEVLWWPNRQRWALGADVYDLRQRDFDRLFGLQKYHVATGHVTLYYQSPWYDLNFQIRAGKYLAGDTGITFQATRRFATGVEVGAFFTKTNVSSARFGEGSFDKGILIRIPLSWTLPIETQGEFALNLRPVQRDGGQTLAGDTILYEELSRTGQGECDRHADDFIHP
jgi:hypothetical protein